MTTNTATRPQTTQPSPDVIKRQQQDLKEAQQERLSMLEQMGKGVTGDTNAFLKRLTQLGTYITTIETQLKAAGLNQNVDIADKLKALCLADKELSGHFTNGGAAMTIKGDNGTVVVGTGGGWSRARATNADGTPATRNVSIKALFQGEEYKSIAALKNRIRQQFNETDSAWRARVSKPLNDGGYGVKFLDQ